MRSDEDAVARFRFDAEIIHWRGPSPFFFAPAPADQVEALRQAARAATYGWGVVPVEAAIGGVTFRTSLFPKDGTYLVPIKAEVRRKTNLTAGDTISVELTIRPTQP
jgi:acetylornithine deacetylase/succinyl-diaminopimelate desuccinylase-like protein